MLVSANATYLGRKPTKNAEYFQLLFGIDEQFRGQIVRPNHPDFANVRITKKTENQFSFADLKEGEEYSLELDVSVRSGNENYRPSINFDIIAYTPVDEVQTSSYA